jgi:hypothetical protein
MKEEGMGKEEERIKNSWKDNLKGRDYWEDLGVDWKIML